jgi:hypothetical protein
VGNSQCINTLSAPLTSEQVDIHISLTRRSEHHAMRMEGRSRDWRSPMTVEEPAVRLNIRELLAIEVENLDGMVRGTSVISLVPGIMEGE